MAEIRLLKIDDLVRRDHCNLDLGDECYFFHEFIARGGYTASDANSLIINFKKPISRKGYADWVYKGRAIERISQLLVGALPFFLDHKNTTFIPIPPSKTKGSTEYDDRLMQVLKKYHENFNDADIRELFTIKRDVVAAHASPQRRDINDLLDNLVVDPNLCRGLKQTIVLFDDMITTGAHFKACKLALGNIPNLQRIIGVFVARRSISASELYEFQDIFM